MRKDFRAPNNENKEMMMKIRFLPFSLIATATATATALLGGANQNSLARFAAVDNKHNKKEAPVDNKHNKKENALVEVAIPPRRNRKLYEAQVWAKPWLNFKELHEFKPASAITCSNLGCKKDEDRSGCREVPGDDPAVQHIAEHAVKSINQMCNCSIPYEIQEVIVHANNTEATGEAVKFNMLLKLKRPTIDIVDKYKVEFHKNHEGALHLITVAICR